MIGDCSFAFDLVDAVVLIMWNPNPFIVLEMKAQYAISNYYGPRPTEEVKFVIRP